MMEILEFLSTPSARRATYDPTALGDQEWQFLSTPSARRATRLNYAHAHARAFLSTPSARRATFVPNRLLWEHWKISIHALREEGDSKNRDKISIFKQIVQHSARI